MDCPNQEAQTPDGRARPIHVDRQGNPRDLGSGHGLAPELALATALTHAASLVVSLGHWNWECGIVDAMRNR